MRELRGLPKKTKILCTVGPSSFSAEMLQKMFKAGMNGVRINTAYGDFEQYESVIENVRRIGKNMGDIWWIEQNGVAEKTWGEVKI